MTPDPSRPANPAEPADAADRADRADPAEAADRAGPGDPSRPAERTRLAWRRTALAAGVVGLLAARLALRSANPVAAALAALPCLALLAVGRRRTRRLAAGPWITPPTTVGVALAVVAYAVLGAALVVL